MNKLQSFKDKYGFDPMSALEAWNIKYLDNAKKKNFNSSFQELVTEQFDAKNTDGMFVMLAEVLQEQGERLPQGVKMEVPDDAVVSVSPNDPSAPKSKGLLEDFKNIIDKDAYRDAMKGVYSTDNLLVGTDAHVLIKFSGTNDVNKSYKDTIIDLQSFLKSKGKVFKIIDEKYPEYDRVIPTQRADKTAIDLYEVYNLAVSAQAYLKNTSASVINLKVKIGSLELAFNPLLLANLCGFWLAKGKSSAFIEHSESQLRAVVITFKDSNVDIGLIMPVNSGGSSYGNAVIDTDTYELDKLSEFSGKGQKATKTSKKESKPETSKEKEKSSEEFKKYTGGFKGEANYIPRRDIEKVVLKNGTVLGTNDIVDGVYTIKKMADGGKMKTSYKKYNLGGVAQSFGSPMIESGMQIVTGNWGGSPVSVFEDGGKSKTIDLLGKRIMLFSEGKSMPTTEKITEIRISPPYFTYRDLFFKVEGSDFEERIPQRDITRFLLGEQVDVYNAAKGERYAWKLANGSKKSYRRKQQKP